MLKTMFFLFMVLFSPIFSQPNYLMSLSNPIQTSSTSLDFDITIKSTDSNFILTSYQCSFSFDLNIDPTDSISLNYNHNSSDLGNFPMSLNGYIKNVGLNKLVFFSGMGDDVITSKEKIVGKFTINSSKNFSLETLNLKWSFSGHVNTILTDETYSDFTDSASHNNFNYNYFPINESSVLPTQFKLNQNYPNPFNLITNIEFSLPLDALVEISVFNLLGQKITTLVNKYYSAGNYAIEYNAENLSSGIYFYKIKAGKFIKIRKMVLMK